MKNFLAAIMMVLLICNYAQAAPNVMPTDNYSFTTGDTQPPYTDGHNPAKGQENVASNSPVIVHVKDDGYGVDIDTIVMTVNGVVVIPAITGDHSDYTLVYTPLSDFAEGTDIYVTIDASDLN